MKKMKQGYLVVTIGFFAISLTAHWAYAWFAYVDDAKEHSQPIEIENYFNMTLRDTMENWQSEFLQLAWQIGGLSFLWAVASPQSKSESDRLEEKVDLILQKVDPETGKKLLEELNIKYPKK